ncbi:unnamed protein product [Cochlearia groenlandica]
MAATDSNQTTQVAPQARLVRVGKACHQCRQKCTNLAGSCITKKKGDRTCPIKYCPRCLLLRYGEKTEEVKLKNDWVCLKCREMCSCSVCFKKEGRNPTGRLGPLALSLGYASVAALLEAEGFDKYSYKRKAKPEVAVTMELDQLVDVAIEQDYGESSKGKELKMELDQLVDVAIEQDYGESSEGKELKGIDNDDNSKATPKETSPKRIKLSDFVDETQVTKEVKEVKADIKGKAKAVITAKTKPVLEEVELPIGMSSITISGIDIPSENAGDVLQFMEFCFAFGKPLELREGQSESVISEILSGRSNGNPQHSTLTQMMIMLLAVIKKDRGESPTSLIATDDSWFDAFKNCLGGSIVKLDYFPHEKYQQGILAYEELDSSMKLKLLNFLCDETLNTSLLRNWIVKQEAIDMLNAAKAKEKILKKKLQDELAKPVTEDSEIPFDTKERDEIISQISAEIEEAFSEMKLAKDMMSKNSKESDVALRTNPVQLDDTGRVLWSLNSYNNGEPNYLLQDVGSFSDVMPHEKWTAFTAEQKPEIEKYISFKKMKRLQAKRDAKAATRESLSDVKRE